MSTPYYAQVQKVIADIESGAVQLPASKGAMEVMTSHVGHPDPGAVLEILGLVGEAHENADDTLTLSPEIWDTVDLLTERWRRADEDDTNIIIGDVLHVIEE